MLKSSQVLNDTFLLLNQDTYLELQQLHIVRMKRVKEKYIKHEIGGTLSYLLNPSVDMWS